MTELQYAAPAVSGEWAGSRETHIAVATAIHAISGPGRSAERIWANPTAAEWDHVCMAVENYVDAGVFAAEDDGRYPWGCETVVLETGNTMNPNPRRVRTADPAELAAASAAFAAQQETKSEVHPPPAYTVFAGNNSTDLGQVGTSKTLLGAKRIGRAVIREALPNGEGSFIVRDKEGRTVLSSERSIRTGFEWCEG